MHVCTYILLGSGIIVKTIIKQENNLAIENPDRSSVHSNENGKRKEIRQVSLFSNQMKNILWRRASDRFTFPFFLVKSKYVFVVTIAIFYKLGRWYK